MSLRFFRTVSAPLLLALFVWTLSATPGQTQGPKFETIMGQPSWKLLSSTVKAYVTQTGGHLGPVIFDWRGNKIAPYQVAPWAEEDLAADTPSIIKVLRGDFFCMPFGANTDLYNGEQHPLHGETANGLWTYVDLLKEGPNITLHLRMNPTIRAGQVDKMITVVHGHHAIYSRHIVAGMSGPMNYGHHATLRFPDLPESGRVTTSGFTIGHVAPGPISGSDTRDYGALKPGARFKSLRKVPMLHEGRTDLSLYPARPGYEDIAILVTKPVKPFAWTAVTFRDEGYVWFALKDPTVLRYTLLWISNGGRQYPPWNGRHVNVMGLEEMTGFFHYGLAASAAPNDLSRRGKATHVELDPDNPLVVNYIMAAHEIPDGFDRVKSIKPGKRRQTVVVTARSGESFTMKLDHRFLHHD